MVPRKRGWLRRWWWAVTIVTITSLIGSVVVGSMLYSVDYVIESPGNLYATGERIAVDGAPTYPTDDRIDLVTVSLDTRVSAFEKFLADHDSEDRVIPAKDVLGNQTPAQNDDLNALLMTQSKDAAVLVALQRLGYNVSPTPIGAVINDVQQGSPADGRLRVAETIVAVDAQPITTPDDVHAALAPHHPGDRVTLTLEALDKTRRTVEVPLGENPNSKGVAFIGVSLTPRLDYPDLSVKVNVTSGSIGGPSAGLAFTLGILDLMTPGDLTGGHEIAATGTIEPGGAVGPIGGIESKVPTVAHQHVKYFLVPAGEDADTAKRLAPSDMQIVPVSNLDDAINFLVSIGGSGLPAPPAQPGT